MPILLSWYIIYKQHFLRQTHDVVGHGFALNKGTLEMPFMA